MKQFYVTFGQAHVHSINGKTFDKDCVGVIEAETYEVATDLVRELTGNRYHDLDVIEKMSAQTMDKYYPRGFIGINCVPLIGGKL